MKNGLFYIAAVISLLVCCSGLRADYVSTVLSDGPEAYYRFEEGAGSTSISDSSGNGHNSKSVTNAVFGGSGMIGSAVEFSNDGNIVLDLQLNPSAGDFSIEMFVNLKSVDATDNYVSQQDGGGTGRTLALTTSNGYLGSYLGGSTTDSSQAPVADTWYHFVITYDSAGGTDAVRFYVDGGAAGTGTETAEGAFGDWVIGSHKSLGAQFVDGYIDELAIYSYRLDDPNGDNNISDSRINAHFNAIPEPATMVFLAIGGLCCLGSRRRVK